MVEQSTAASRNLAHETQGLQELVAFFRVETQSTAAVRPAPAQPRVRASSPPQRAPAHRASAAVAVQPQEEWSEF
jgi:hypothetical protein